MRMCIMWSRNHSLSLTSVIYAVAIALILHDVIVSNIYIIIGDILNSPLPSGSVNWFARGKSGTAKSG